MTEIRFPGQPTHNIGVSSKETPPHLMTHSQLLYEAASRMPAFSDPYKQAILKAARLAETQEHYVKTIFNEENFETYNE